MTTDVVEIQQEFLRRGAESRYEIITLTDEELAAVDGEDSVAPRYWYAAQSPVDRDLARAVASRGLAARGWATADPAATDVGDLDLQPTGPLLAVLSLRRNVRRIVVCEQKDAAGARSRVYYLPDGSTALEEAVNTGGLHRFSTLPVFDVATELARWSDPQQTPEPAEPWEQTLRSDAEVEAVAAERLSGSRLASVIVLVDRRAGVPRESRVSVYVEPGRACMTFVTGKTVTLKDVGHGELRRQLSTIID